MGKSKIQTWWRSAQGVLTRLEGFALRGWLRELRRDLGFSLMVVVILAMAIAGFVSVVDLAEKARWGVFLLAFVLGFVVLRSSFIAPGSPIWRGLQAGAFQPWAGFGSLLKHWVRHRAIALTGLGGVSLALIVAITHAHLAVDFIGGFVVGACAAAMVSALPRSHLKLPELKLPTNLSLWTRLPQAVRISLKSTAHRRVGNVPVWLLSGGLWALATPASALATHNNPGTHMGLGMITVAGLICGLALASPNLPLIRFLAFQPIGLPRFVPTLCGPQVGLVAILAMAAALGAGQPVVMAVISAAIVVGGVCLWLCLLIPHAMTRSVGAAPILAIADIAIAALVQSVLQFGLLAIAWLIVRIIINIRAVARKRWREPS